MPRYASSSVQVARDQNRLDLRRILEALQRSDGSRKQELMNALRTAPLFRATNYASKGDSYRKADDCYLDSEGLHVYLDGNPDAWHLHREYEEDVRRLARTLGASEQVRAVCRTPYASGIVSVEDSWGWHVRGLDGFDPECHVQDLEWALEHMTLARSRFIWNKIAVEYATHLRGVKQTRSNEKYDWESETTLSPLGQALVTARWLPEKNGAAAAFRDPSAVALEELPEDFQRSSRVAKALGMQSDERQEAAEILGVSVDEVDLARRLKEHPEYYHRVVEWLAKQEGTEFPVRVVRDRELRKRKIIEQTKTTMTKERQRKDRRVRTSEDRPAIRLDLMSMYTNTAGEMVCQLCHEVMPFRKPDGQFYFEAVELLSTLDLEMDQMYLAMCPTCAAKYKIFVKDRADEMERVRGQILRCNPENAGQLEIVVDLGQHETPGTIRFVEPHLMDIQTILETVPPGRQATSV